MTFVTRSSLEFASVRNFHLYITVPFRQKLVRFNSENFKMSDNFSEHLKIVEYVYLRHGHRPFYLTGGSNASTSTGGTNSTTHHSASAGSSSQPRASGSKQNSKSSSLKQKNKSNKAGDDSLEYDDYENNASIYADSPKNIPVFSLFFLISEGSFFNNSGTDVTN